MIGKLRWHCNRALEQHFNVKKHGMVDRWSTYWWITMHKIFRSMMSKLSRWHCDRVEWQYLNLKTCYHEWNRYWKIGRHDIFTWMISMLSTWHCNGEIHSRTLYACCTHITGQVRARTLWGEEDSSSFCKSSEELPLHVPSYWVSLTSSLLAFTLLCEVLVDISVCAIISDMHGTCKGSSSEDL